MSDYIFPFSTCEKHIMEQKMQPYSFAVNLTSTLILLYILINYISKPKYKISVATFIATLVIFEGWHTFSHYRIMSGSLQFKVIHSLTYLLTFILAIALRDITKMPLDMWQILIILIIITIDLYFANRPGYYAVLTGVLLFITVFSMYIMYIPAELRNYVIALSIILVIGVLSFIIESKYCNKLMKYYELPYHLGVELSTMLFLILFSLMIISWSE